MIQLSTSNIRPIKRTYPTFYELFGKFAVEADHLKIATGYVSIPSLLLLKNNVLQGKLPGLDLTIGMHAFDLFTKGQYEATMSLAETLKELKKGSVHVCTAFPYHGKTYTFWNNSMPRAALIGSSNLSGIDPDYERIFEIDIAIKDKKTVTQLALIQDEIQNNASKNVYDWEPDSFKKNSNLMGGIPDVEQATPTEISNIQSSLNGVVFNLPLKDTDKSNLNAYFGKGRENTQTGLIRPRPWYEIEVIVPKSITQQHGYPRNREFTVITDDGWKFNCVTNGDYSKNFRSQGGLTVLGSWIKGRLEAQSIIKVGDKVTMAHIARYGKDHIALSATNNPGMWHLSFAP